MHTCVCFLDIQQSRWKEGNARFVNEGHLCFFSIAFGFHCWKVRYVSELFSFLVQSALLGWIGGTKQKKRNEMTPSVLLP